MKKYLLFFLVLLSACSGSGIDREDFYRYPERMNGWAAKATIPELCEAMSDYQEDGYILNRVLIEFRRRNISYMNCPQYEDMMEEINKNKRPRV